MIYKKAVTFFVVTLLLFGCVKKTNGLRLDDIETLTIIYLSRHVQYNKFTDEISERTLDNFLNQLDPGKYYFYKSDTDEFMKHKDKIDDYVREKNFSIIFQVQERYKSRFQESLKIIDELLNKEFNFDKDESIIIDRGKIDYAADRNEMKERWRKNVKLQLLNQISSGNDINDAKKKLTKKYKLLKKRIEEIDTDKMMAIFVNSFTTALDPHSNYLTQEEHEDFQISTNLKLEGIGVLLREEDGFIIVERIIPGGPSSKLPKELQLMPGDKIVAVAQDEEEPVDVIDMALRDVVKLIRGKQGTIVKLTILREVDESNSIPRFVTPITREEITLEDKAARSEVHPVRRKNSEMKIGYIRLPSFYMDFDGVNMNRSDAKMSSKDMIVEINKLKSQNINGMIIDLRGNPGGALTEAVEIAGMFIDKGPIVQILMGKNSVDVQEDRNPGVHYDGPVVLLVDKFSASASEIFAGAIKDYKRGLVIGPTNTFGKGSVQTYNVLRGGNGAMKITSALFYQPGGESNQLNGVEPDITVPDISSIWDIGEDKLRYPLKWEMIEKAKFSQYNKYLNTAMLNSLKEQSTKRIAKDEKFTKLIVKIDSLKEKRNKKTISLKEEAKIETQEIKNMEEKERQYLDDNILIDTENDLFLREAFDITYDYIKMMNKK
ncbi:MAG: carboxy terminal-processing peptidase [Spirochaetes bacterium]|nr:carboxy terminal-processing peptidase [Spirochaetota bacterium]